MNARMWPTTKPKIRAKIASYRRALRREMEASPYFSDGYGKRFWLFHLYYLLGEEDDVRQFIDWYRKKFPEDAGEVGQLLCWALILRRLGREGEAIYRLVQAIDDNPGAVAKVVDDYQGPYGIWGEREGIQHLYDVPNEVVQAISDDEQRWLAGTWNSPAVAAYRKRRIEIGRALVHERPGEARSAFLDEQVMLVYAFRPKKMPPLSYDARKSWLTAGRKPTRRRASQRNVIRFTRNRS